jgi:hypothetical protein
MTRRGAAGVKTATRGQKKPRSGEGRVSERAIPLGGRWNMIALPASTVPDDRRFPTGMRRR